MPIYIVTLAARPARSSAGFQNHTLKLRASIAADAITAAAAQLEGAGFEILASRHGPGPAVPYWNRLPDGYPDHSPELGN